VSPILGIWASQNYSRVPATSYESIATVNVGAGGTGTISFTSIPSTYKHLQIRAYSPSGGYLDLRLNGDNTTSNYRGHALFGSGSGTGSSITAANAAYFPWTGGWSTSNPWVGVMDILDYSNTNKNKTLRILEGTDANGSGELYFNSILWMSTSAISSITLSRSGVTIGQYSSFALYGIRG
jgi:hypothetical protein